MRKRLDIMITFRKAEKKDFEPCIRLLANSFWGYEYFEPFVKNQKRRYQFEHAIQEVNVKAYFNKTTMLAVSYTHLVHFSYWQSYYAVILSKS